MRAAIGFLTCVPAGRVVLDRGFGTAVIWFPIVGFAIGATCGAVASTPLGGALATVTYVVLTGALHLDGLADSADAVGATNRNDALRIMRDSRIGAFGATAIGCALLVRTTGYASTDWQAAASAGALSRAVPIVAWPLLGSPRQDGMTSLLTGGLPAAATGVLALILALLSPRTLIGVAVAIGAVLVQRRALGGMTGDSAGATIELTELAALLAAAA